MSRIQTMRFLVFLLSSLSGIGLCNAEDRSSHIPAAPAIPATQAAEPATAASWSGNAQEVMMNAISLTGIKYKYGGISPETGFDCSGFVRYVFQQATNLTLPHGARAISQIGQIVSADKLQPGDLVFFNTLKSTFSHVGIYLGDNRFIHSPSDGGGVAIVDMNDNYWIKRYTGARRITSSENKANSTE